MPLISFIAPIDQPLGRRRVLDELRSGLRDQRFSRLSIIVAYAKSGPLLRLQSDFLAWKAAGKHIKAIIGYDQQGTSREAMSLAFTLFDELYATRERGITFHPKVYLFEGLGAAKAIVGSNNLTVGGTETNFECATVLELDLPEDQPIQAELQAMWSGLLPPGCPATQLIDNVGLQHLIDSGALLGERAVQVRAALGNNVAQASKSGLATRPASPLPAALMRQNAATAAGQPVAPQALGAQVALPPQAVQPGNARLPLTTNGFAIQIKPHRNGEIFLSKTAALQDPSFFGWPFTGNTVPKKIGNPSYPQRDPDPIVNIEVFGPGANPVLALRQYALNTVYYAAKSEIRITASPLVGNVPDYSVMVMTPGASANIDYEIAIYRPDSADYQSWLAACNQTMPGGGQAPRNFGWF